MDRNSTDRETVSDLTEYDHFVDGSYQPSAGAERIDVTYPYTGAVWASVPNGTPADVDAAVEAANRVFTDTWGQTRASTRRRILNQIADTTDEYANELTALETRGNGKLIREMGAQMRALGDWYRYYASLCDTIEGRVIPTENKDGAFFTYTRREPLGVVGMITPWNSPLLLTTFKLAPALAAGNTVVHKPSEVTPVSALRFAELLATQTDLPDGVYNVVTGDGNQTGAALTSHEAVDKLAFTGSTDVGRTVGHAAAERVIPVTLELGGKSPNIVFPSASLENAVTGIVKGIFAATGQTCLAGSRVLVHESITSDLVDQLVDRAESITLGDPMDPETEMGPVAFPAQAEMIDGYLEVATDEGATVATGGDRAEALPGECFIQPTVLTDVDNEMRVAREEIFGPVVSLIAFEDEAEAIDIANDTPFGLAAGVWTEDLRQAQRVASAIEAGTIWVNEYRTLSYKAPFGGYNASGLGRENGEEGLDAYLQTKTVWIDQSGEVTDPFTLG